MRTGSAASLSVLLVLAGAIAQQPAQSQADPGGRAPAEKLAGTGAPGKLVKWTSATNIGSSTITEAGARIGIGTTTPAGKLTVGGAGACTTPNAARIDLFNNMAGKGFAQCALNDGSWQLATTGGQRLVTVSREGNVGVGVESTLARLEAATSVPFGAGLQGSSPAGMGVYGVSNTQFGVRGIANTGVGVEGASNGGTGVRGFAFSNPLTRFSIGVEGSSPRGIGVKGSSETGNGVVASAEGPNPALHATNRGTGGIAVYGLGGNDPEGVSIFGQSLGGTLAGFFDGKVRITGGVVTAAAASKIDHPLDPENRYLTHSLVESPDMTTVYNGNVVLDAMGEAAVRLPAYVSALDEDFRYQLTPIGAPGPNLYVSREIAGDSFRIAGGGAGEKVSWQVTGIRHDAYAKANRLAVEEDKPERERGFYVHPEAFGEPEEKGLLWATRPGLMKRLKAERQAPPALAADTEER